MAVGMDTGFSQNSAPAVNMYALQMRNRTRSGADWFIWIGALSVINTLIAQTGGQWHFIFGLGIADIVNEIAAKMPSNGQIAAIIVNVFVASLLALFGKFARDGHKWAFLVGMICYGLDAALMLMFQQWLPLAFHAFALYRIYTGFTALNHFQKAEQASFIKGRA